MSPADFMTWSRTSNSRVKGSDRLMAILNRGDFIHRMRTRITRFLGDAPEIGLFIQQLTIILSQDEEYEAVVERECGNPFVISDDYIWFCFWCSVIISDHIRRQIGMGGTS